MARLQILELPEGADDERPPFVLVIDQYEQQRIILGPDQSGLIDPFEGVAEEIGARAVLVFRETIDIPANDLTALSGESATASPDFNSPIAGKVEVRRPCPYCDDGQMIPRHQFKEHIARLHPDETPLDA